MESEKIIKQIEESVLKYKANEGCSVAEAVALVHKKASLVNAKAYLTMKSGARITVYPESNIDDLAKILRLSEKNILLNDEVQRLYKRIEENRMVYYTKGTDGLCHDCKQKELKNRDMTIFLSTAVEESGLPNRISSILIEGGILTIEMLMGCSLEMFKENKFTKLKRRSQNTLFYKIRGLLRKNNIGLADYLDHGFWIQLRTMNIAHIFHQIQDMNDITYQEFSDKTGIPVRKLWNYYNKQYTYDINLLHKVCKIFKVELNKKLEIKIGKEE